MLLTLSLRNIIRRIPFDHLAPPPPPSPLSVPVKLKVRMRYSFILLGDRLHTETRGRFLGETL